MKNEYKNLVYRIVLVIVIGVPFLAFPGMDWRHLLLLLAILIISWFDIK